MNTVKPTPMIFKSPNSITLIPLLIKNAGTAERGHIQLHTIMKRLMFALYFSVTLVFFGFAGSMLQAETVKILVSATFAEGMQPLVKQYPDLQLVSFSSSEEALR
jgi:hypothetical protein